MSHSPASELPLPTESETRDRVNAIFDAWQDNHLSFTDALKQMRRLQRETHAQQDYEHEALVEGTLGIMYGYRGSLDNSISHFEKARDLYQRVGNYSRVVNIELNIAECQRLKGELIRARRSFQMVHINAKRYNNMEVQVLALANEGHVLVSLGDLKTAKLKLNRALELGNTSSWRTTEREEQNWLDVVCEIHHSLVNICIEQKHLTDAWEHAQQALRAATELGRAMQIGYANRAIGRVMSVMTTMPTQTLLSINPDDYFKTALRAFRKIKAEGEIAKTLFAHAESLQQRGKRRRAAQLFGESMLIFTKLGMNDDAAKAATAQLNAV